MTTLRLLTTEPPRRIVRHPYVCGCLPCQAARAARTPAVCECDRPTVFADPTADGEPTCLRCGRPALDPSLDLEAAA